MESVLLLEFWFAARIYFIWGFSPLSFFLNWQIHAE